MGKYTANDLDPGAYKPGSLREPTHPMSNPVSVGDDLVERSISGETVAGLTVLGWMTEVDIPGIGLTRRTDYHWSTPGAGKKVTRLVDAAEAASQLAAVRADNSDLLAAADADAFTIGTLEAQLKAAREENEALRGHVEQLVELLDIIKEHWVDYDHVYSISVHSARAALNPKAPS